MSHLPGLVPSLSDRLAGEFLAHTLDVLAFPTRQDPALLDTLAWAFTSPEPPRAPDLPTLPTKRYPTVTKEDVESVLRSLQPPPAPDPFIGRKAERDQAVLALLSGRPVVIQGQAGAGRTTLLRAIAHDPRIRKHFRRVWWFPTPDRIADALSIALNLPSLLALNAQAQQASLREILAQANVLLIVDHEDTRSNPAKFEAESLEYLLRFGTAVAVTADTPGTGESPKADPPILRLGLGPLPDEAIETLSGQDRPTLIRAIGGNARVAQIVRALIAHDGLRPTEIEALLSAVNPAADLQGGTLAALHQASWEALPDSYQQLAMLIAEVAPASIPLSEIWRQIGDVLAVRRAVYTLERYRFIEVEDGQVRAIGQWWAAIPALDLSDDRPRFDMELPLYRNFREREAQQPPDPLEIPGTTLYEAALRAIDDGRDEEAATALEQALALRRKLPNQHAVAETLAALGRLAYLRGDDVGAVKALEEAATLLHELRDDASLDLLRVALSRVYMRAGRIEAAFEVLPERPPAADAAWILAAQGKWDQALAAAETEPDPSLRRYLTAAMLVRAGQYAKALALIGDDDAFRARYLRAQILHAQGDFERALRAYDKADALPIGEAERGMFVRDRARAMAALGQFREAAMSVAAEGLWYESKLRRPVFARTSTSHALHAAFLLAQEQYGEAEAAARRSLSAPGERLMPETRAIAQHVLGRVCQMRDDPATLAALQAEVEAREESSSRDEVAIALSLHALGDFFYSHGEAERAIGPYRRALPGLKEPRQRLMTLLALRDTLLRAGRIADGLEAGEQAIEVARALPGPDLPVVGYAMASQADWLNRTNRGARGTQQLLDWCNFLANHPNEAIEHPHWGVQVLWIGLTLRSERAADSGFSHTLIRDLAEEAVSLAEAHLPGHWVAFAARRDLGLLQAAEGDRVGALETLRPLTQLPIPEARLTVELTANTRVGELLLAEGRPAEAQRFLAQAAALEPERLPKGRYLRLAGTAWVQANNPDRAEENFTEALQYLTPETALDDHVGVLVDLGYARLSKGQFSEAIETLEQALNTVQELPDQSLMAAVLIDLGNAHDRLGQYRRATAMYRRALGYPLPPDRAAATRLALARSSAAMGANTQALDAFKLLDAFQFPAATRRAIYSEQAALYAKLGNTEDAIRNFNAALKLFGDGEAPTEKAHLHRALGQIYAGLDRHAEARIQFEQALHAVEDQEAGLTMLAIAEGHRAQGDTRTALDAYGRALPHLDRMRLPVERAMALRTMGELFLSEGRAVEAIASLEGALDIEKTLPRQDGGRIVAILSALAEANVLRGDLDKATARHHQALVYQDARHAPELYSRTLRKLGQLYIDLRRYDDAVKALEDALGTEYSQPTPDQTAIAETTKLLADATRLQGRLAEAADLYRRVVAQPATAAPVGDPAIKAPPKVAGTSSGGRSGRIINTDNAALDAHRAPTIPARPTQPEPPPHTPDPVQSSASQALAATLGDIARHEETLRAAEQSWALLNRTTSADLKSLLFVLALQGDYANSDTYTARLMTLLRQRRSEVAIPSPDPAVQALAALLAGQDQEDAGDYPEATIHYRDGLRIAEQNRLAPALIWVFRQKIGKR
jgi:tetratricopeptide (TPR) repeat protein